MERNTPLDVGPEIVHFVLMNDRFTASINLGNRTRGAGSAHRPLECDHASRESCDVPPE